MAQNAMHLLEQGIYVDIAVLQRLLAREGQHPLGEFRAPLGGLIGRVDAFERALVILHQLLDELEIAEDDHQQVVEVMGHTPVSWPTASIFWACMNFRSRSLRSVMHWQVPKIWSTSPWPLRSASIFTSK